MGDKTTLAARLDVGSVSVDPGLLTLTDLKAAALQDALRLAIGKSLRNYDYQWREATTPAASPGPGPISLDFQVMPLEVSPDARGTTVVARFKAVAHSDVSACFPYEAKGDFHVVAPLHSGSGQKAFAILVVVASAAAGVNAGMFAEDQFNSANAQQAALNSGRIVTKREGVAPQGDQEVATRYGAVNALQYAVADFISHLGEAGGCGQPATPTVLTNAQPVAATPPAPQTTTSTLSDPSPNRVTTTTTF